MILGLKPMTVAISALALALLSGTGAAAQQSLPNSLLYPLKLATEQVRLVLTPSSAGKVKAHLDFADRRLAEAQDLSNQGAAGNLVADTLDRYGQEVQAVGAILPGAAAAAKATDDDLPSQVGEKLAKHQVTLNAAVNKADMPAVSALKDVSDSREAKKDVKDVPTASAYSSLPLPIEAKSVALRVLDVTEAGEAQAWSLSRGKNDAVASKSTLKSGKDSDAEALDDSIALKPSGGVVQPFAPMVETNPSIKNLEVLSGQMRLVDLEGGCWYLADSQGKNYQLVGKLAASLNRQGLYVKVVGSATKNLASTCMIGELFEVERVLESSYSAGGNAGSTATPPSDSIIKPD
jgi:hypothetical protein